MYRNCWSKCRSVWIFAYLLVKTQEQITESLHCPSKNIATFDLMLLLEYKFHSIYYFNNCVSKHNTKLCNIMISLYIIVWQTKPNTISKMSLIFRVLTYVNIKQCLFNGLYFISLKVKYCSEDTIKHTKMYSTRLLPRKFVCKWYARENDAIKAIFSINNANCNNDHYYTY